MPTVSICKLTKIIDVCGQNMSTFWKQVSLMHHTTEYCLSLHLKNLFVVLSERWKQRYNQTNNERPTPLRSSAGVQSQSPVCRSVSMRWPHLPWSGNVSSGNSQLEFPSCPDQLTERQRSEPVSQQRSTKVDFKQPSCLFLSQTLWMNSTNSLHQLQISTTC